LISKLVTIVTNNFLSLKLVANEILLVTTKPTANLSGRGEQ